MACDRRRFCQLAAASLACGVLPGLAGAARHRRVDAGAADLPLHGARWVAGAKAWVCRDDHGFYAVAAKCTHGAALVVLVTPDRARESPKVTKAREECEPDTLPAFVCPAHCATFNFNGDHPTGQAKRPLDHLALDLERGRLVIDASRRVPARTRVALGTVAHRR
jgi:hypothetical protein